MAFWICCLIGVLAGAGRFGCAALRLAHEHQFESATRALRKGGLLAAGCAMLSTVGTFGWPIQRSNVSVAEEVTRTVIETVNVPVQVTRWIFFTTVRQEVQEVPREIRETVFHSESRSTFQPWLLVPMVMIGLCAFWMELMLIRLIWRLKG